MESDFFDVIVDQLISHYARMLNENIVHWREIRLTIAQFIDDHAGEVGEHHPGFDRLKSFADIGEGL